MKLTLAAPILRFLASTTLLLLSLGVSATSPAPDPSVGRYEAGFLERMIDHHGMAVEMATTCEHKATHHDLKELCTDIRLSQAQEIDMMQGWLRNWYARRHAPVISPADMQRMDKLAALHGAKYEINFMQMMMHHHRKAVRESGTCQAIAYHGALVEQCEGIIDAQLLEVHAMHLWLLKWYGIGHSNADGRRTH